VTDTPQVLLEHYLKQLKLPTKLREYARLAEQCAKEGVDLQRFLLRLVGAEVVDRERRATDQGGEVSGGEELGDLRLSGDSVVEQEAGRGTGAVRVDRAATERAGVGQ
jgi:hypothetical protein